MKNISAINQEVCILPKSRVSEVFYKIMGEISKADKDCVREETEESVIMKFWRQRNRGKMKALI